MRDRDFLMDLVRRYALLPSGVVIERPCSIIRVGDFAISRRSLKHIVERRLEQDSDPSFLIIEMLKVLELPEVIIINPRNKASLLVLGPAVSGKKSVSIVMDLEGCIVSAYYKRWKQYEAIKSQLIDSGGAADPSSFLPEGNLAASLSALRNRSAGSLPAKRISKEKN